MVAIFGFISTMSLTPALWTSYDVLDQGSARCANGPTFSRADLPTDQSFFGAT